MYVDVVDADIRAPSHQQTERKLFATTEQKYDGIEGDDKIDIDAQRVIVRVSVQDFGVGISEENRQKLFQPCTLTYIVVSLAYLIVMFRSFVQWRSTIFRRRTPARYGSRRRACFRVAGGWFTATIVLDMCYVVRVTS